MLAVQRRLVSEAEFLALPESLDKVELLDGEVIVSPSPSYWHQEVLQRIVFALLAWARKAAPSPEITIGQAPLDVRFGPGRILQPDAFVLFGRVAADHVGPVDQTPVICIEVLSSNRAHDRITKRFIYGAAGVRELWVVEPAGLVERWSGEGLGQVEELRGTLHTHLLPGFELDLPLLFRVE